MVTKRLFICVGPPGSGKSTRAEHMEKNLGYARISQDDQGKEGHFKGFLEALEAGKNIVVDRMNFNKEQRRRYISLAKDKGYWTEIFVIHESTATCLDRISKREGHPTIKTEHDAKNALNFFFSEYERPEPDEADNIQFYYPPGPKPEAVIVDLDGTLCNIDHRLHFVKPPKDLPEGQKWKKDWKSFSESCVTDTINEWCYRTVVAFTRANTKVVFASGRSDEYRAHTEEWLEKNRLSGYELYMRLRNDYRQDCIIKQTILDFELLTRYQPLLFIDDRAQVVSLWRSRGFVCLACAEGEF